MKKILKGKQVGIVIALVLGFVILFLPAQDSRTYRFQPGEIASAISENRDQIDPVTLSEWVIEGRRDYLLVDIRDAAEYQAGNIKGSYNIPLQELLQKDTIESLPKDKMIVLYSNGSSHSSQAWLVLHAAGFAAYVLEGGFNYWSKVILNPQPPSGEFSDDEILRYKMRLAVKNYFAGQGAELSAGDDIKVPVKKKMFKIPKKKKKLKGC